VSLTRRRVLAAVPLLVTVTGCSSLFAGPDPLAGPPSPAADTVTLEDAITAERALIALYLNVPATSSRGRLLAPILTQHQDHLAQLSASLLVPSGAPSPSPSPAASVAPVTMAALRAAELRSCTAMLARLVSVPPSLAQLFASIAASDATHAVLLAAS
jgi:hypothetical protein